MADGEVLKEGFLVKKVRSCRYTYTPRHVLRVCERAVSCRAELVDKIPSTVGLEQRETACFVNLEWQNCFIAGYCQILTLL